MGELYKKNDIATTSQCSNSSNSEQLSMGTFLCINKFIQKRLTRSIPLQVILFAIFTLVNTYNANAIDLWWIGGTGTQQTNVATNWSTTNPTTLTTTAVSPPTAQDDIYFVNASFPIAGTYNINTTGTFNCRNIVFSGVGNSTAINFQGSGTINHYGSFTSINSNRLNYTYTGTIVETFNPSFSLVHRVYDLNGETYAGNVEIQLRTTDTISITSGITISNTVTQRYGTFIVNSGTNPTLGWLYLNGTTNASNYVLKFIGNQNTISFTKQIAFQPFFNLQGTSAVFNRVDLSQVTIFVNSSASASYLSSSFSNPTWLTPIRLVRTQLNTQALNTSYNNCKVIKAYCGSLTLTASISIDTLEIATTNSLISSHPNFFSVISLKKLIYPPQTCNDYLTISGISLRWKGNYYAPAGTDTLKRLKLIGVTSRDSNNAIFVGINKTIIFNSRDEKGISAGVNVINNPVTRNLYWIGGNGNWHDITHWSLSSGGAALPNGSCPPTFADNVFFDANSFTASGQAMTIGALAECKNMTWDNLAFTDIDWLGNGGLNLFGSLRLDNNMKHLSLNANLISLYGRNDSIVIEGDRNSAPWPRNVDIATTWRSHYDVKGFAYFKNLTMEANPSYLSFDDTAYFNGIQNFATGLDTLDFNKNSTQFFFRGIGGPWIINSSPCILHNSNSWVHVTTGDMRVRNSTWTFCTNGRYPNIRVYNGGTINADNNGYRLSKLFLSGFNPWTGINGNSISLMHSSTVGIINCTEFRTTDTLLRNVLIGLTQGLEVVDSLVFMRRGQCLNKNIFAGAGSGTATFTCNPNKIRMTGTQIARLDYNGTAPPLNLGLDNFDGGANVDIIFGGAGSVQTFYWRKNPATNSYAGSWELPNNWTIVKSDVFGAGSVGCAPTAADSVVFDYLSSDGGNYTINASNAFSCKALHGDSCRSKLTFNGNGTLTLGGTFRINTSNIVWNHAGSVNVGFTGTRNWALGNNTSIFGDFTLNGPGTFNLDGNTTKRWYLGGKFFHTGGSWNANNIGLISVAAYYGASNNFIATNCTDFIVRSFHAYNVSSNTRVGMLAGSIIGTGTRFRFLDAGAFHQVNNFNAKHLYLDASSNFAQSVFYGNKISVDSLITNNILDFRPSIVANHFKGITTNSSFIYIFNSRDTFVKTFYASSNTQFNTKNLFNETYLLSDRTHAFAANDTQFFRPTGSLVKVGDLSKVINFISTSSGSRAVFSKPINTPPIYLCNIDVKDVKADSTPVGTQFRTNNVSIFNNAPGWRVISAGAGAVSSWQDAAKTIFRGDSANFTYLWDSSGLGPFRLIYTVNGFNRDSFTVQQEVYKHNVYLGNFTDSSFIGNVVSRRFECPGIYIPDSVNATKDTFYIQCPQTENGLTANNKKGVYFYKNLNAWVYMMDTSSFKTICAFWDKTNNSDKDSLKKVDASVKITTATQKIDSFYVAQRNYQITPANNKASRLRLFLTKTELDSIRIRSGFVGTNANFVKTLRVLRTPNAQVALSPYSKHVNTGSGIATEVNANTFYIDIDLANGQWSNFYIAAPALNPPVTRDTTLFVNSCFAANRVVDIGNISSDIDGFLVPNVPGNLVIYKASTQGSVSIVNDSIVYNSVNSFTGSDTLRFYIRDLSGLRDSGTIIYKYQQLPGGVNAKLALWLKADAGFNAGAQTWRSQTIANQLFSLGSGSSPSLANTGNLINFNPAVDFVGNAFLENTATQHTGNNSTYTKFGVFMPRTVASSKAVIGSAGAPSAGVNIHNWYINGTSKTLNGYRGDNSGTGADFLAGTTALAANRYYLGALRYGFSTPNGNGVWLNGTLQSSNTTTANYQDLGIQIGADQNGVGGNIFNGEIPEVILYDSSLSLNEVMRVETYLGLKYGISLSHDYLSGSGTTIWNRTANNGYNNAIFGIGRDDCQGLFQKQAQSYTADLLTLGLGTITTSNATNTGTMTNTNFEIVGNNAASFSAWSSTNAPAGVSRIGRAWKVQETGTVGAVTLRVPHSTSSATSKIPAGILGDLYLIVDTDSNFTTGASLVKLTLNGTNWEGSYDFNNGDVITFGYLGLIRKNVGDFQVSAGCPLVNGSGKVVFTDLSGNLVFSIDPKGNNLGNVCWGIRILPSPDGSVRRMDMQVTEGTIPYQKAYVLDRNLFTKVQYQPGINYSGTGGPNNAGNPNPTVEWYFGRNELRDILVASGKTMNDSLKALNDSMRVTKFSPFAINTEDLIWDNNRWMGANSQPNAQTWLKHGNDFKFVYDVPSFSEFWAGWIPGLSPAIPLPINFLELKAKRLTVKSAQLNWSIDDIQNLVKFRILRSADGKNWLPIAELNVTDLKYEYIDLEAGSGYVYYQIAAIEKTGFVNNSKVAWVQPLGASTNQNIQIYPNPGSGIFNITLNNSNVKGFQIELSNINGQILKSEWMTNGGALNLKSFKSGIYHLKLISENEVIGIHKIVILD